MTSALIGMMVAWLFLLIPAALVAMIPSKKMKYEKKVGVEAVIWMVCSIVVLFLHTGYGLVTIFAYAALTINASKIIALPILILLEQKDRRKYIVFKRLIRKF